MTETPQETEVVIGALEGVTQKKADTWQVAVKPEGSQYAKNLWTKDAELVAALGQKLGQGVSFVCNASYWTNSSGTQVRSLWIAGPAEGAAPGVQNAPAATQAPAPTAKPDVDWDAKERRDYRSRAWAQTISAMGHTVKVDEEPGDIYRRLYALQRMIYRDIVRDLDTEAHPDDDIPFG